MFHHRDLNTFVLGVQVTLIFLATFGCLAGSVMMVFIANGKYGGYGFCYFEYHLIKN